MRRRNLLVLLLLLVTVPVAGAGPSVNDFLSDGKLDEGEKVFAEYLSKHPDEAQARFSLGVIRFLQAVEHLGQFFYTHGTTGNLQNLPLIRVGASLPANPDPVQTAYADYRQMLKTLLADLEEAQATLAKVEGKVKLPIQLGRVRLDLTGDGTASDQEALWRLYAEMNPQFDEQVDVPEQMKDFPISFDTGDVYWLRGYCHLLSAICEVQLAYDGQRWFDHCGHLLFPKAQIPYSFLTDHSDDDFAETITDAIAAIHLADFELIEPERMAAAREHLLAMTELSRQSWQSILAESDNDREWIPNADQKSVVGIPVTAEIITTWQKVLDDLEALLRGQKLVPFWRSDSRGVNLKRVLTEPRDFDLVLWIQGTAAVPYLEEGETISTETWSEARDIFRGNFIGFAIWFN